MKTFLALALLVVPLRAHCTGIAVYKIRELAGLFRRHCPVGAVGATFELGQGLDPGSIAR